MAVLGALILKRTEKRRGWGSWWRISNGRDLVGEAASAGLRGEEKDEEDGAWAGRGLGRWVVSSWGF